MSKLWDNCQGYGNSGSQIFFNGILPRIEFRRAGNVPRHTIYLWLTGLSPPTRCMVSHPHQHALKPNWPSRLTKPTILICSKFSYNPSTHNKQMHRLREQSNLYCHLPANSPQTCWWEFSTLYSTISGWLARMAPNSSLLACNSTKVKGQMSKVTQLRAGWWPPSWLTHPSQSTAKWGPQKNSSHKVHTTQCSYNAHTTIWKFCFFTILMQCW